MRLKILLTIILLFFMSVSFSQSYAFEKQGIGVTFIIHGWNPDGELPVWLTKMSDAIIARNNGEGQTAEITVTGSSGNITATCSSWDFDISGDNTCEIVVLVNWTAVANHLTSAVTAQEVAAAIAPKIYESQNDKPALAELPIHMIGHSRGGGMVFEIARLLGLQGIDVEQITSLDPHPLTSSDIQPLFGISSTIDTQIKIYENVLFVDNYYQQTNYPKGESLTGAYNRFFPDLSGGYHNESGYTYTLLTTRYDFSDHLNIILGYYGTIDLTTPVSNGEATITETERGWYNEYENQGDNAGFYYSRIIAGDRKSSDTPVTDGDAIIDGYNNNSLPGGNGSRNELDQTDAVWPNVLTIDVLKDDEIQTGSRILDTGDELQIDFDYRTFSETGTLTFIVDTDMNPYNDNNQVTVENNINATASEISAGSIDWTVENLSTGTKYYICTKISCNDYTRYLYADYEFEIQEPTRITAQSEAQINVFPNPVKSIVHIKTYLPSVDKVEIRDITGKLLIQSHNESEIDISYFKSGLYFLKVTYGNSIDYVKILKE